jgi:hypothetical protein
VKDANGCTTSIQSVSVTSCFSVAINDSTNVTCPGGNDRTIEVTATGGSMPYTVNGMQYNTNPFTITGLSDGAFLAIVSENGGNSANFSTTVNTTPDNTAPTVITQNITVQLNASITAAQINNGSSDVCGIASMSLDVTSFDCSNVGANTVTLTVTDVNGNSSTGTTMVTVEDNTAPTVVTQNMILQLDAATGTGLIMTVDIDNG